MNWIKYSRDLQDAFKFDCGAEDMKDKEVRQCWREIKKIERWAKQIDKLTRKIEGII